MPSRTTLAYLAVLAAFGVVTACTDDGMAPTTVRPAFPTDGLPFDPIEDASGLVPRDGQLPCRVSVRMSNGTYAHMDQTLQYPRDMIVRAAGEHRRFEYRRLDQDGSTITKAAVCWVPDDPGAPAIAAVRLGLAQWKMATAQGFSPSFQGVPDGLSAPQAGAGRQRAAQGRSALWGPSGPATQSAFIGKDECDYWDSSCITPEACDEVNGMIDIEAGCMVELEGFWILAEMGGPEVADFCGGGWHWDGGMCVPNYYGVDEPYPLDPDPPGGGGQPQDPAGCAPTTLVRGQTIECYVDGTTGGQSVHWTFTPAGGSAGPLPSVQHTGTTWQGTMVWSGTIDMELRDGGSPITTSSWNVTVNPRSWTTGIWGTQNPAITTYNQELYIPGCTSNCEFSWVVGGNIDISGTPGLGPPVALPEVDTVADDGPNDGYGWVTSNPYSMYRTYWINDWLASWKTPRLIEHQGQSYNPYEATLEIYADNPESILIMTAEHEMLGSISHQSALEQSVSSGCGDIAKAVEGVVDHPTGLYDSVGEMVNLVGSHLGWESSHWFVHGVVYARTVGRWDTTPNHFSAFIQDEQRIDLDFPQPTEPCPY